MFCPECKSLLKRVNETWVCKNISCGQTPRNKKEQDRSLEKIVKFSALSSKTGKMEEYHLLFLSNEDDFRWLGKSRGDYILSRCVPNECGVISRIFYVEFRYFAETNKLDGCADMHKKCANSCRKTCFFQAVESHIDLYTRIHEHNYKRKK